jgi:glycosyltransferase involved in cell wall biosynthesis
VELSAQPLQSEDPAAVVRPAPRVSVIVPAYGLAHLLGEALASLQAQNLRDWEAIVVDDGAPDDVAGAFAAFGGDPRFRLLRTDNGGLATARNRAIAAARAPFVSLLDADDLYEPTCLSRLLAAIQADPGLGFVTCDAILFGPEERTGRRYSDLYALHGPVTLEGVVSRKVQIFVGSIIRRTALDSVGGFDGGLRAVEDLDLWIRLLAAGWRGEIVPEPLARYRRRPGSLSSNDRNMLRAGRTVYRKAVDALEGRPEQAPARTVLTGLERELRWRDGEDLILMGQPMAGLRLLAGAEGRSRRWRLALRLMRRAPWLATALMRLRGRLPPPHMA